MLGLHGVVDLVRRNHPKLHLRRVSPPNALSRPHAAKVKVICMTASSWPVAIHSLQLIKTYVDTPCNSIRIALNSLRLWVYISLSFHSSNVAYIEKFFPETFDANCKNTNSSPEAHIYICFSSKALYTNIAMLHRCTKPFTG